MFTAMYGGFATMYGEHCLSSWDDKWINDELNFNFPCLQTSTSECCQMTKDKTSPFLTLTSHLQRTANMYLQAQDLLR